jgi:hypothetical protein
VVHVFDAQGEEVRGAARTFQDQGMRWTELVLGAGATAAIVRGPVTRE